MEHYANWKIRSAILDFMREMDWLSRDHRKVVKTAQAKDALTEAPHPVSVSGLDGYSDRALESFGSVNANADLLGLLRRAELPTRLQTVLAQYYYGERTMKNIGKSLHVNESRVSQLHKRAIEKLQATL